jgi:hypothetical protein
VKAPTFGEKRKERKRKQKVMENVTLAVYVMNW